jgi:hypothetical protein
MCKYIFDFRVFISCSHPDIIPLSCIHVYVYHSSTVVGLHAYFLYTHTCVCVYKYTRINHSCWHIIILSHTYGHICNIYGHICSILKWLSESELALGQIHTCTHTYILLNSKPPPHHCTHGDQVWRRLVFVCMSITCLSDFVSVLWHGVSASYICVYNPYLSFVCCCLAWDPVRTYHRL